MATRRRTMLLFTRQADGAVERLTLDRYGHGDYYHKGWEPDQEEHFACLAHVVRERDPQSIALNYADEFPFGDGLSHSEYGRVIVALGEPYAGRITERRTTLCRLAGTSHCAGVDRLPRSSADGSCLDCRSLFQSHHSTRHYDHR